MNCQAIRDNLSAYLDRELTAEEMGQVEAHLQDCPECRQELAELQQTIALLNSLDECIPPARFRRELRSKLEQSGGKKSFSWEALIGRLPKLHRSMLAPVAAVMVLFIVVIPLVYNQTDLSMLKGERNQSTQNFVAPSAEKEEAKYSLRSSGLADGAAPEIAGAGAAGKAYDTYSTVQQEALTKSAHAASEFEATTFTAQAVDQPLEQSLPLERKIIKNAELQMQVDSYAQAVEAVKAQVASLGGYISNESVSNSENREVVRGYLQVRLPYQQFEPFLNGVESIGKLRNRHVYTNDVTEEFVDLESRLRALKVKEERLLALLGKAGQLADVLAVENELANTRAQLESLQGRLRYLSNQVEYSTININIEQVTVPTQTISTGGLEGVFQKAKEAFIKAVNNILLDTGKLVVWISSALPYLIILSALVYVFWRWVRRKLG